MATFVLVLVASVLGQCWSGPIASLSNTDHHSNGVRKDVSSRNRWRRDLPVGNRANCPPTGDPPAIRVNTTERLMKLRQEMSSQSPAVHAYIVPMGEQHQSEYVSDYDKRVEFISGFSGSAGTAVVMRGGGGATDMAALWTDGRYFLQADDELDCNWILMRQGQIGVPSITEWLRELPANSLVAADPKVITYDSWNSYRDELARSNIEMREISTNLIDSIWTSGRPAPPNSDLLVLDLQFAGVSWQDKVQGIQGTMKAKSVDLLAVTALDETAWLYNMRGEDVDYNPVFVSYALVEESKSTLYVRNHSNRISPQTVRDHLQIDTSGQCSGASTCVAVKSYDDFVTDLRTLAESADKVWVSPMSSYGVYSALGANESVRELKAHIEPSPIRLPKARKNQIEIQGMRNSHARDSAAVIEFITMLEKEVQAGEYWDEITAADKLAQIRGQQLRNRGLSFGTISAVGKNGAVIHYTPSPDTNRQITTSEMYLLDSGGQYLDGTTDVTRTFHFGTPSDYEKEAYTRVLLGAIDLALTIWPNGTYGRDIDARARAPLWEAGMDYRHGTGHGLGAFLNVHEGPGRITMGYRASAYEEPLYDGMFFSDEPGFYEDRNGDNNFGVRLETIVMVKKVNTTHEFGGRSYLGFEPFTLVPFEKKLIKYELFNDKQRQWLNDYHTLCRQKIADVYLKPHGKMAEYNWVYERTEHIPLLAESHTSVAAPIKPSAFIVTMVTLFYYVTSRM